MHLLLRLGDTSSIAGPFHFNSLRAKEISMLSMVVTIVMTTQMPFAELSNALVQIHGEAHRERIVRGLNQVKALWTRDDGDLAAFAREFFVSDPGELDVLFRRFEQHFEQLDGHFLEIGRALRQPSDVDVGSLLKADALFAAYDPSAHLVEDLFSSRIAFVALLNFPQTTLQERIDLGATWTRRQWAEARLTGRFTRRVPSRVQQEIAASLSAGELYIAQYNLWMHHVLSEKGERLFPSGKRLISHWNLRDELKANYSEPNGLVKQQTILKVMERIVTQTIPLSVIDNPEVDWNPFSNQVTKCPAIAVERDAVASKRSPSIAPEPNTRYQHILSTFVAQKKVDAYSPIDKTAIDRAFSTVAEMPEARVRQLLESVLRSPLVKEIAREISAQLARPLLPVDLWFHGFRPKAEGNESTLDSVTQKRYPNAAAFASDLPRILKGVGFSAERATSIAEKIKVDPARGAGHAMQAARRGDFAHLRTRIEKNGMDYKGYNIAIHELGHNVEQTVSLYDVDHTLLAGVPNTAFTEAIAFVFQARDLELLGMKTTGAEADRLRVLNDFWQTFEIAGVALVELDLWHWLYAHPKATAPQLRDATVAIAKRVWNEFYAPHLGARDAVHLAIYSHMVSTPLYLFNYPLGHLIAFQIEEQIHKAGVLGPEIERMAKMGAVTPDVWMRHATGDEVSALPLFRATEAALRR